MYLVPKFGTRGWFHWKYFYPQKGNIEQIMERDNKLSDLESQATNLGENQIKW